MTDGRMDGWRTDGRMTDGRTEKFRTDEKKIGQKNFPANFFFGRKIGWLVIREQVYHNAYIYMIIWSYHDMIISSYDHMIIWSYDHMIIWSYHHMIIWSYDHMITWSYDHMVTWSYDHMIIWSWVRNIKSPNRWGTEHSCFALILPLMFRRVPSRHPWNNKFCDRPNVA